MGDHDQDGALALMEVQEQRGHAIRDMFGAVAPRYDLLNRLLSASLDVVWRRRAAEALRLESEHPVLDLCCGDGIWAKGIRALNPNLDLYGIDISEGGIQRAQSLLPSDAQRFIVDDAEYGLPWPDGTFDLIFARGPGLFNQHSMDRPATPSWGSVANRCDTRGLVIVLK